MPVILRVRGFRFFFYSLENREPAHIHVADAGRYAKFWLAPVALAGARGFRGHELTHIREIVIANREMLVERWNDYSANGDQALAVDVACTRDALSVVLSDGRTVTAPLAWFPRLLRATPRQRAGWEFIGGGIGIHWETIDEDISVASLLKPECFMRLPDSALPPAGRARSRKPKAKGRARARA